MKDHCKPPIRSCREFVLGMRMKLSFVLFILMTIVLHGNVVYPSSPKGVGITKDVGNATISDVIGEVGISENQQRMISGTILDMDGAPLPGASILVKDTTIGVVSDFDGNYSIAVPDDGKILIFSYLGFKTIEEVIGNRSAIDVQMQMDAAQLDDVVVIGYGTQKSSDVTGSVSKADMSKMENMPLTNVTQALRGRVAGVQFTDNGRPGQQGSVLIRGKRSITANNDPLIILDGSFFYGSMSDLNPNDIESMAILKDASATAIYGSRAANGVILITSKMGTSSEPVISVNSFYGAQEFSYKTPLLSPERYIQKTLDYRQQRGLEADPSKIESYLAKPEVENYRNNKTIDPYDIISQPSYVTSTDLSVSGKAANTNYLFSMGRMEEKGLIHGDNFKRLSARTNLTTKINDWLKVGMNAMLTINDIPGKETSNKIGAITNQAHQTSPYSQFYLDREETILNRFPVEDQLAINPLIDASYRQYEDKSSRLFSTLFLELDVPFVKNLKYKLNYSPNFIWAHQYDFIPIIEEQYVHTLGSASKTHEETFNWMAENILTYKNVIGSDHSYDITLIYGRNANNFTTTAAKGVTLFNDANGWNNLGVADTQTVESTALESTGVSSMFRLNYRFMDRYGLTLTARRDGSSVFGMDNKFATFPSAAFAWSASRENFMKDISWLDLLKFRISYGKTGNQAIDPYQSLERSKITQYVFGDGGATSVGIYPSGLSNSNLSWETTISSNIGVDFGILGNRISGTFEYYDMKTIDLLLDRALPSPTGFSKVITNLGEVNNSGVELSLNALVLEKGKFEWSSNFVFSHNKNKIVNLYGSDSNNDGKEDDDLGNRWFIGQPISVNFDYVMDGIYQVGDTDIPTGYKPGDVRLKDTDGVDGITPNDRQVISNRDPKIRWGFTNEFKYGNLGLSVFVNGLSGWSASNTALDLAAPYSFPGRPMNFTDIGWWTEGNQSNTRPSLTYSNPLKHGYYQSRDFVRIQDVSLSYNFPTDLLKSKSINSLKLFVSGRNLFTFTDWSGWDPESGYTGMGGFPTPRTYALGFSVTF